MDQAKAQRENAREPPPNKSLISALTISFPKCGDVNQWISEKFAADSVTSASSITSHNNELQVYVKSPGALIWIRRHGDLYAGDRNRAYSDETGAVQPKLTIEARNIFQHRLVFEALFLLREEVTFPAALRPFNFTFTVIATLHSSVLLLQTRLFVLLTNGRIKALFQLFLSRLKTLHT